MQGIQLTNAELSTSLQAEVDHCAELENQLKAAYSERVEMAKTCLEKDDEVTQTRRQYQQSEEMNALLQQKNDELLQEIMGLKETI